MERYFFAVVYHNALMWFLLTRPWSVIVFKQKGACYSSYSTYNFSWSYLILGIFNAKFKFILAVQIEYVSLILFGASWGAGNYLGLSNL